MSPEDLTRTNQLIRSLESAAAALLGAMMRAADLRSLPLENEAVREAVRVALVRHERGALANLEAVLGDVRASLGPEPEGEGP